MRNQVVSHLAKKLLAFHSTGSIGYYVCLIIQTQLQLSRYIHACTNEMHSLVNLQDLIHTLAGIIMVTKGVLPLKLVFLHPICMLY